MKRLAVVLFAIGCLVTATPLIANAIPPVSALRSGAFVDSEAYILGTFWSESHAFHVAIYRERQVAGTTTTRVVVERERLSDGVVDAVDDLTLGREALTLGPHPTRVGFHQLTFDAELPETGTWDLTFSGRLSDRNYVCLHGLFSIDSSGASTNLPSTSSTIDGAPVVAQSQCFQWGGPGDGTYSTPWAATRPPLLLGF